jgi:beta-galactosidase GanA
MLNIRNLLAATAAGLLASAVWAQTQPLPKIVEKDGRYALFVDDAPFLMLGAQVNNSSAWPAMLPKVWPAIEYLQANTVEMPVYWEQFEPRQGQFDSSVVDTLISQAREHHVRLVLLWFGTWKNGSSHYMPLWMKRQPERYPRMVGRDARPVDSPSPFARATLEADTQAFTALMRHLKAFDPQRTVIMVQVENEPGAWRALRDYSPAADKLFEGPVPAKLLAALHKDAAQGSSWKEAFGPEAEEYFHAWSVARYIGQVAAAGKAEYPLPMYTNASLRDPLSPGPPGSYETGGPTDNVLGIWKAAAPALEVLSPDIYFRDSARYLKVLELYHRPDNALFVPETGNAPAYARYFFAALGHQAIGFSPFGIDYTGYANPPLGAPKVNEETLAQFALNYKLAGPMMRDLARLGFEGKLHGVAEPEQAHTQTLDLGPWKAVVNYGLPAFGFAVNPPGNKEPVGRALIADLGDNTFLVAGFFCRVDFQVSDVASGKQREYLRVEEGAYRNGEFKAIRIWNGDQTDWGLNFGAEPAVLRVSLGTY